MQVEGWGRGAHSTGQMWVGALGCLAGKVVCVYITECVWMLLWDAGCACVCPIICVLVCLCVWGLIGVESLWVCHCVPLCVCCFLLSLYQWFWSRESHPCHISALTQTAAQEEGAEFSEFLSFSGETEPSDWDLVMETLPAGPQWMNGSESAHSHPVAQGAPRSTLAGSVNFILVHWFLRRWFSG